MRLPAHAVRRAGFGLICAPIIQICRTDVKYEIQKELKLAGTCGKARNGSGKYFWLNSICFTDTESVIPPHVRLWSMGAEFFSERDDLQKELSKSRSDFVLLGGGT